MLNAIKKEYSALTHSERWFLLFVFFCSFLIQADYATIRPVSNAFFITQYGSDYFPYAWIATIPLNMLLVGWYNKYLPRLGCFKIFLVLISAIVGCNLVCAVFIKKVFWLPFAFYVWKEVYIMLMFQQLWSVIHSKVAFSRAKYLYGLLFGVGACGAITGSVLPGFFAVSLHSENLLFTTLPLYLLLGACYFYALKHTDKSIDKIENEPEKRNTAEAFLHGLRLIRSSRFLLFIFSIVVFMQVSSSLIDYQFNHFLETRIIEQDLRVQYTGRVLGIVHMATLLLQFIGSFLMVHFLGIKRSHFFIPFVLGLNSLAFIFFPTFGLITFSYIAVKSFDFSLFGIIKEMMYIPLKKDDKFRAKAFIDVFTHRTSKALASLLILGLQCFHNTHVQTTIAFIGFTLFVLWCLLVARMIRSEPIAQEANS